MRLENWIHQTLNRSAAKHLWAMPWENVFMPYANNKGADLSAQSDQHLCCSLHGKNKIYKCYVQNFKTLDVVQFFARFIVQHKESWVNYIWSVYFPFFLINFAHQDLKNLNSASVLKIKLYPVICNVKIFGVKLHVFRRSQRYDRCQVQGNNNGAIKLM